jgi:hypothetical protein
MRVPVTRQHASIVARRKTIRVSIRPATVGELMPKSRLFVQNFGSDGVLLFGAANADAFIGVGVAVVGMALLFCSALYEPLELAGRWVMAIGVVVAVIGSAARWLQCKHAGSLHRAGQPVVRRPK